MYVADCKQAQLRLVLLWQLSLQAPRHQLDCYRPSNSHRCSTAILNLSCRVPRGRMLLHAYNRSGFGVPMKSPTQSCCILLRAVSRCCLLTFLFFAFADSSQRAAIALLHSVSEPSELDRRHRPLQHCLSLCALLYRCISTITTSSSGYPLRSCRIHNTRDP